MSSIYTKEPRIEQINLSSEVLEKLQLIAAAHVSDVVKEGAIKKFTGFSSCSVCRGIPFYKIIYDCDGASKVEIYCDKCVNKTYDRNVNYY